MKRIDNFDPDTVRYAAERRITGLSTVGEGCEKCGSRHTCQENMSDDIHGPTTTFCHTCGHIRPGNHGIIWIEVWGTKMVDNWTKPGKILESFRVPGEVYRDQKTGLFEIRAIRGFERGHTKYVSSMGKEHGSGFSVHYSTTLTKMVFGPYPSVLKQGVIRYD